MLPKLKCVLISSLIKCVLEYGFKGSCAGNFAILAEKYLARNVLLRKLQYVKLQFFERSAPRNCFLGIDKIFNITITVEIWTPKCDLSKE